MYNFPARITRDAGYLAIIAASVWMFVTAALMGPSSFSNEAVFCVVVLVTSITAAYNLFHLCTLVDDMYPGFRTKNITQEIMDIAVTIGMAYFTTVSVQENVLEVEQLILMVITSVMCFKHIFDYTIETLQS